MSNTNLQAEVVLGPADVVKSKPYFGKSANAQRVLIMLDAARKTGKSPLLWGPPGVGKTALIRAYAEAHDLPLAVVLGSQTDPTELQGLPVLKPSEDGSYMVTENTLPDWADMFFRAGKGVLFLDEITTVTPTTQAALLTLIQDRRIGQKVLPDEVFIVAAGNPSNMAADGWELAPPTANRFMHIDYEGDRDDWFDGMLVGFGKVSMSESELEMRQIITAFVKHQPNLWNALPMNGDSVDEVKAGRAWPSPRSWDNAAEVMGQVSDLSAQRVILRGFVGDEAANSFDSWRAELKLPSYEDVMRNPKALPWKNFKASETYLILNMVATRAKQENADQTLDVFLCAAENGKTDVGVATFNGLIRQIGAWAQGLPTQAEQEAFRRKSFAAAKAFSADLRAAGLN